MKRSDAFKLGTFLEHNKDTLSNMTKPQQVTMVESALDMQVTHAIITNVAKDFGIDLKFVRSIGGGPQKGQKYSTKTIVIAKAVCRLYRELGIQMPQDFATLCATIEN